MLRALMEAREERVANREEDPEPDSVYLTYNEPEIGVGEVARRADLPDGEAHIDTWVKAQKHLIAQRLIIPVDGPAPDGLIHRVQFASQDAVERAKKVLRG